MQGSAQLQDYFGISGVQRPEFVVPMTQGEFQEFIDAQVDPVEVWCKRGIFWAEVGLGFVPCGDTVGILYHGGMWALGVEVDENRIDFLMSCVGLAADLGYIGAAAGVVSNGAVAAVRIAFKYIEKIDHGVTLKMLLKVGPDALKSIQKIVQYAMKYRPEWLASVNLTSVTEVAAAVKRFATEVGELLSNTYTRMRKSKIAGRLEDLWELGTQARVFAKTYEDAVKSVNHVLLDRIARKAIPAEAAEGWHLLARIRNVPELDGVVVKLRGALDLGDDAAKELADVATGRYGTSVQKTLNDVIDNSAGQVMDPNGIRRVRESAYAIGTSIRSPYRNLVHAEVGPGRAFATMEEFEGCRFMKASSLTEDQVAAIKRIRQAVEGVNGAIQTGTPLRKVISIDSANRLTLPAGTPGRFDPTVRGFFTRTADVQDLTHAPAEDVRAALALDYPGHPYSNGYATIEFPATSDCVAHTRTPKSAGFYGGANDRYIPDDTPINLHPNPFEDRPNAYPYTGNGFTASRDGTLRGEWHLDVPVDLPNGAVLTKCNGAGQPTDVYQLVRSVVNGEATAEWLRIGP